MGITVRQSKSLYFNDNGQEKAHLSTGRPWNLSESCRKRRAFNLKLDGTYRRPVYIKQSQGLLEIYDFLALGHWFGHGAKAEGDGYETVKNAKEVLNRA